MLGPLHAVLLKVDHENGHRRWGDARDARGLAECAGLDTGQFLTNFVRQTVDLPVIKTLGQGHGFELLQARHLLQLTPDIALVLEMDLDLLDDRWWQCRLFTQQTDHISVFELRSLQQLGCERWLRQGIRATLLQQGVDRRTRQHTTGCQTADLRLNTLALVAEVPIRLCRHQTYRIALVA